MIPTIARSGGCAECASTTVRWRYADMRTHSIRIRHEPGCPALARRRALAKDNP